jgi:hypothetical protein
MGVRDRGDIPRISRLRRLDDLLGAEEGRGVPAGPGASDRLSFLERLAPLGVRQFGAFFAHVPGVLATWYSSASLAASSSVWIVSLSLAIIIPGLRAVVGL